MNEKKRSWYGLIYILFLMAAIIILFWWYTVQNSKRIEKQNLNLLGVVPHDDLVYRYDCDGKPTVQLPADSPVRAALKGIVEKLHL